ncbi:MAG: protein kinase, partial [Pyrinomonadaceae bacterium]
MNPERWQQIQKLFQACLDLDTEDYTAFLDKTCADDPALRAQVEALLASDTDNWSLIGRPALELAAPWLADDQPQLAPGQRIAHYEIVELIGRGGMGEVYLAKDEILNRPIALKFLPADYTKDKDRLRRFQREAQATSALNHPGILTIYQLGDVDGRQFIATELVQGETLRRRIARGRLNVRDALDIAIQIASALGAAHQAGIVHRDIKPENIMLRPDGYVKVLDFGLAKLAEQYDVPARAAVVDRIDASSGVVMGTVRYMSPEQARGLQVDARTDVFSLGVVLYEMITGRAPFASRDAAKLVESILKDEPPSLANYVEPLPGKLPQIISKCLSKEKERRYQHAGDLLKDLKNLKEEIELDSRLLERSPEQFARSGLDEVIEQDIPSIATVPPVGTGPSPVTSTFEYITNGVRRPRQIIALTVLLFFGLLVGYTGYKFLRQAKANPVSPTASTQALTWTTKASISSPRDHAEPAVLNDILYVVGGWNVCTPFANLESYDPITDTWTQRAPLRTARGAHGVAALNGLLYAVGGSTDCGVITASVEAYDPVSNSWSSKASLPTKRNAHVVAVAHGKLYAIGGNSNQTAYTGLNTEYDSQTDTWTERARMPTPRSNAAAAVVNDIIYVIGGAGDNVSPTRVEAYDPRTDSWAARAPMPTSRSNFAAAVLNGIIYVLGGPRNGRQVDAYDPVTDTWTKVGQMPAPRYNFHAVALQDSIYFAGGYDAINYLSSTMAFTPGNSTQPQPMPCPSVTAWTTKA